MSVTPRTRQIVLERDAHRCQRCGRYIGLSGDYSLHHRRPRGMGGTKRPETDLPANLVTLCGSGTTGCHEWVESNRVEARVVGLILTQQQQPDEETVLTHRGWLQLDDDGAYVVVGAA